MNVEFERKFLKDLDKFKRPKEKEAILNLIEDLKKADGLDSISGVKKLVGFEDAYRIRFRNLRVGFFLENEIIVLARIAHRKEFYRLFP